MIVQTLHCVASRICPVQRFTFLYFRQAMRAVVWDCLPYSAAICQPGHHEPLFVSCSHNSLQLLLMLKDSSKTLRSSWWYNVVIAQRKAASRWQELGNQLCHDISKAIPFYLAWKRSLQILWLWERGRGGNVENSKSYLTKRIKPYIIIIIRWPSPCDFLWLIS